MSDALLHVAQKLDRASEQIVQLNREIEIFLGDDSQRTLFSNDQVEREAFMKAELSRRIPVKFSVLTGEVLYQLRSSLDHVICLLVEADKRKVTVRFQFPIFTSAPGSDKERKNYERQIAGISRAEVRARIEARQPYKAKGEHGVGGNWLGIMRAFSNTDKHRQLVLHVGHVQPRVTRHAVSIDPNEGYSFLSDSIDDGGDEDLDGIVNVTSVERRLTSYVVFPKWGTTGRNIDVIQGLNAMLKGTADIVDELSKFV